jgi:hypothetical protein
VIREAGTKGNVAAISSNDYLRFEKRSKFSTNRIFISNNVGLGALSSVLKFLKPNVKRMKL